MLLEKLDLTGLEAWPKEQAEKAHSLLKEYHNIFSLEKHNTGHTKATKHKIVLKDPDTPAGGLDEEACRPQESSPYEVTDSQEVELLTRKMRGCTSPVTLRRLYQMILFCKLRWLLLCESRR